MSPLPLGSVSDIYATVNSVPARSSCAASLLHVNPDGLPTLPLELTSIPIPAGYCGYVYSSYR